MTIAPSSTAAEQADTQNHRHQASAARPTETARTVKRANNPNGRPRATTPSVLGHSHGGRGAAPIYHTIYDTQRGRAVCYPSAALRKDGLMAPDATRELQLLEAYVTLVSLISLANLADQLQRSTSGICRPAVPIGNTVAVVHARARSGLGNLVLHVEARVVELETALRRFLLVSWRIISGLFRF